MENCPHEQSIQALQQRDGEIMKWMERLEGKLDNITSALVDVKRLEDRNISTSEALDRAFKEIEKIKEGEIAKMKERLSAIEAAYNRSQGAAGMFKFIAPALWTTLGGALMYLVSLAIH